jgi:hypothetical protein
MVTGEITMVKTGIYQGRRVPLDKIMKAPELKGKQYKVYTMDGNKVVKVGFGDPNMRTKRQFPKARANFRARHRCDTDPAPKTSARYWACVVWDDKPISELLRGAAGKGRYRY